MSFEKTNQELKDELLISYRLHFAALYERDRLRDRLAVSKRKQKEAEKDAAAEIDISQNLRERNRELNEELTEAIVDTWRCREALDVALDLVGAVIETEAAQDIATRDLLTYFRTGGDVVKPLPPSGDEDAWSAPEPDAPGVMAVEGCGAKGKPERCISCNGTREDDNYYFCEKCFELDNDFDFNLFAELSSAWDKGERNFPREGKNAKELAKEIEGEGER